MTGEMKDALLPCPFCGSPALLEHDSDHHGEWFNLGCSRHYVAVDPDKACIAGRIFYTEPLEDEEKAIAAWNRRSLLSTDKAVGELREALTDATAHLAGAASAYRKYARRHRAAGFSQIDPLFSTRANDFDKALDRARAALTASRASKSQGGRNE